MRLAPLILTATLLCSPSLSRADNLDDAKAAFAAGKQAFERGDYEAALTQFQRANQLSPAPSLQYNLGKTFEALGRYQEAAAAFDRYLELAGAAQNDEDQKFQDNLRARATADRQRPDRSASAPPPPPPPQAQPAYPPPPPPQYPPQYPQQYPPPNYYQPQPYNPQYGYNPYQMPAALSRTQQLEQAKGRRGRAIALTVIGGSLTVIGLGLIGAFACDKNDCIAGLAVGINVAIVGPTLLIPGAVSWGKSQKIITDLSKPQPTGIAPSAAIFSAPTFRF